MSTGKKTASLISEVHNLYKKRDIYPPMSKKCFIKLGWKTAPRKLHFFDGHTQLELLICAGMLYAIGQWCFEHRHTSLKAADLQARFFNLLDVDFLDFWVGFSP